VLSESNYKNNLGQAFTSASLLKNKRPLNSHYGLTVFALYFI